VANALACYHKAIITAVKSFKYRSKVSINSTLV
jgi:hypothetical protein